MQNIVIQRLAYHTEETIRFALPDDMEVCLYSEVTEKQKTWISIYPFDEELKKELSKLYNTHIYRLSTEHLMIVFHEMYFLPETSEENRFQKLIPKEELNNRFQEITKDQFIKICGKTSQMTDYSVEVEQIHEKFSSFKELSEEQKNELTKEIKEFEKKYPDKWFIQSIVRPVSLNLSNPFKPEVLCSIVYFNSFLGTHKRLNMFENEKVELQKLYSVQPEYSPSDEYTYGYDFCFADSSGETELLFWVRVKELLAHTRRSIDLHTT